MFNLKAKFLMAALVLFIGGVSAANAQLVNGSVVTVSVPNEFFLMDKSFEAGVYTIERTPSTIDSPSLLILRGDGGAIIFDTILARSNKGAAETQLIFDTVGDINFLSEIVVKGQTTKNQIAKTSSQRKMMSEGAVGRTFLTVTNTGL